MIAVDENSVIELLYAGKETNRYCVTDDEDIKKFTSTAIKHNIYLFLYLHKATL
jgi:hypothetical protein